MVPEKNTRNAKEIKVSVAGSLETDTGQKTSTLMQQLEGIPGIILSSFLSSSKDEARLVLEKAGLYPYFEDIKHIKTGKGPSGSRFFTDDPGIFLAEDRAGIVIVSEIDTSRAVEIIYGCLQNKRSVVNLNAVSEVTLGVMFKELARESGVIYTVGAGDEPAATLELVQYCYRLGLDIIAAGKGKNNPLDIYSNPDDFSHIQEKTGVSCRSIASFVDGTKTMLEMAILSNATGFRIDKTGMHGPGVSVGELPAVFCPAGQGGILKDVPAVDYAVGNVAPGVFVIFTSGYKSILDELKYLKMGTGPYYALYKPYHLGNIESPLSIFDIALDRRPTLTIKERFVTNVAGRAKRVLNKGERLDGPGGYTYSGLAVDHRLMEERQYMPVGLLENGVVARQVQKDGVITLGDVKPDKDSLIYRLWQRQLKFI